MSDSLKSIVEEEVVNESINQGAVEGNLHDKEFISKVYTVAQDKVFISATIKLGLRNYSNIELNFGISQNIDQGRDPSEVADAMFNNYILPNVKRYAAVLAQNTLKIIDILENVVNNTGSNGQKVIRG
uniref:Uncharacterized protein n=1 Tax=Fervidobacterium pennivorans TaxID=93466 RepID=A0A7V4FHQ6_FERPE